MRYVFPESIDDAMLARALPRETLVTAFGLRWLHDGRGTFWPAGSGSGMSAEELLRHGPLAVEWLPPIPEDEQANALFSHVFAALQSRRGGLDENYAALMTLPEFFKEQNPRANPGSFAVGVAVEFPSTWIDDRLAELDIDRAAAKDLVWSDAFKHVQELQAAHAAQAPRPTPEDAKPAPSSESPLTAIKIPVGHGFTYRDSSDGSLWTLLMYRSDNRVGLGREQADGTQELRDRLPLADLERDYEFVGCNHDDYCCTLHRHHTMPHRGCIMR